MEIALQTAKTNIQVSPLPGRYRLCNMKYMTSGRNNLLLSLTYISGDTGGIRSDRADSGYSQAHRSAMKGEYRGFKGRNLNGLRGVNTGIGNLYGMNMGI